MKAIPGLSGAFVSAAVLIAASARADPPLPPLVYPEPGAEVLRIWPGAAPGSEAWTWREQATPPLSPTDSERRVRNVAVPTLTVFRPAPGAANGTAVVIAPGGGFRFLSIDSEGYEVARWLAAHGVTSFVLRYRLQHTPESDAGFQQDVREMFARLMTSRDPEDVGRQIDASQAEPGAQDGLQAIRVVRRRAADWGIDPHRIGILGFSAGGMVADYTALHYDPESRPDFVGSIYAGMMSPPPVPADAPPLFAAVASDDPLGLQPATVRLFDAWLAAKKPAELHVFQAGGHGFGMNRKGTTSDHFIEEFYWWLQANGWAPKQP